MSVPQDGLALCALVHAYNNSLLDYSSLSPNEPAKNLRLALELAEKELGIPPLIQAEDLLQPNAADRPDEQCMIWCVSMSVYCLCLCLCVSFFVSVTALAISAASVPITSLPFEAI